MLPETLRGDRLALSIPVESDLDRITEYCADPVFEQFLTTPWPYTRAHAESFVRDYVPRAWKDDTEYTWAATNYVVDTDSVPGRIDLAYGISRPTTALRDMNGVIIRFAAGYAPLVGDPPVVTTDYRANIPTAIKQALFLLVGHWYENREEVVTGAVVSKIPQVSEALLAPYRLWPI